MLHRSIANDLLPHIATTPEFTKSRREEILLPPENCCFGAAFGLTLITTLKPGRSFAGAPGRCPEQENTRGVDLREGEGRSFAA